jgi:subtilisin family serine protease
MSGVFDAHYRVIQEAFARTGRWLAIAHLPNGDVDYVYEQDRLLVAEGAVDQVLQALDLPNSPETVVGRRSGFATVSIQNVHGGRLRVPDALELLDRRFNGDVTPGQTPLVSPNHLVHIERLCAAVEPEPPCGASEPLQPCPSPVPPVDDEEPVRVGLVDSGLVTPVDPRLTWLQGVRGDDDPVITLYPDGRRLIPPFAGHGTFVAGVTRSVAPMSDIYVGNELDTRGAELEDKIVEKAEQLVARHQPAIINISSGTYCRHDWAPIGFTGFRDRNPDLTVVAAAGNDGTSRPLYPAAFDWVISVGALGPDQTHRAWFSNFGPTVDVYTLGEGMVNAFTTGEYRYHEPPRRPARQTFELPIARWDGTSFAAPLITGMIASRMGRTGESSQDAWRALLADATQIEGIGPSLRVG